jgi:hypothetical protein
MFSARGVALNVTTANVLLRMLQNSVYLPRGQSYQQVTVQRAAYIDVIANSLPTDADRTLHNLFLQKLV